MHESKYSDVQIDWIKANFSDFSTSTTLAHEFEKIFDVPMSDTKMRSICKRLGLRRGTQHRYTPEEDQWLLDNANTIPYSKLSEEFSRMFNVTVSKSGLNQHCIKLCIFSDNPNEFNNKIAWNKVPIGSETVDKRYGCKLIKTEKGWINKARYIYEQAFGAIPEKHQVIFLDGNRENYDLDNLYCIPLKYMYLININKWWGASRELTLTAIEWCKLYYAL